MHYERIKSAILDIENDKTHVRTSYKFDEDEIITL